MPLLFLMMGNQALALILGAILVVIAKAQIFSHVSSRDVNSILLKSDTALRYSKRSTVPRSRLLRDIYFAFSIKNFFQKLHGNNSDSISCNCDIIKEALTDTNKSPYFDAKGYYDLFYAVSGDRNCGCGVGISANTVSALGEAALKLVTSSFSDIDAVAAAVLATKVTGVSPTTASQIYLAAADRFKAAAAAQSIDLSNISAVLEALVVFRQEGLYPDLVADLYDKGFQLLPNGDGNYVSDPLLALPLSQLTDKKMRLIGARMIAVTESLLSLRHSSDLGTLSKTLQTLAYVATYKFNPVFLSLDTRSFAYGDTKKKPLALRALDSLGRPAEVVNAEVTALKPVGASAAGGAGKEYLQGSKLEALTDGSGSLTLDLSSEDLLPGKYAVQVAVSVVGQTKPVNFQGFFVISNVAQVDNVSAGVSESASLFAAKASLTAVRTQNALSDAEAVGSASAGDYLHVQYEVSGSGGKAASLKKPHQSFVRLTREAGGESFYFGGKRAASSEASAEGAVHTYEVSVSLSSEMEKFAYKSGSYLVSIIAGDLTYAAPVEYVVGTVTLNFPAAPVVNLPLYTKSLLHTSDVTLKALPEIVHVMRPPARRASDFMALVFTLLVLLPLVAFVGYVVVGLKPDLSYLSAVSSLAFVGSIGAILALYVAYWLSLPGVSFYQTIYYLCILFPVAIFAGRYSIAFVASAKEQGSKAT